MYLFYPVNNIWSFKVFGVLNIVCRFVIKWKQLWVCWTFFKVTSLTPDVLLNCFDAKEEELNERAPTHHSFFSEVYSDCSDELGVKLAICVLVQEACFPHARVTKG